jgi:hypothetical protein
VALAQDLSSEVERNDLALYRLLPIRVLLVERPEIFADLQLGTDQNALPPDELAPRIVRRVTSLQNHNNRQRCRCTPMQQLTGEAQPTVPRRIQRPNHIVLKGLVKSTVHQAPTSVDLHLVDFKAITKAPRLVQISNFGSGFRQSMGTDLELSVWASCRLRWLMVSIDG